MNRGREGVTHAGMFSTPTPTHPAPHAIVCAGSNAAARVLQGQVFDDAIPESPPATEQGRLQRLVTAMARVTSQLVTEARYSAARGGGTGVDVPASPNRRTSSRLAEEDEDITYGYDTFPPAISAAITAARQELNAARQLLPPAPRALTGAGLFRATDDDRLSMSKACNSPPLPRAVAVAGPTAEHTGDARGAGAQLVFGGATADAAGSRSDGGGGGGGDTAKAHGRGGGGGGGLTTFAAPAAADAADAAAGHVEQERQAVIAIVPGSDAPPSQAGPADANADAPRRRLDSAAWEYESDEEEQTYGYDQIPKPLMALAESVAAPSLRLAKGAAGGASKLTGEAVTVVAGSVTAARRTAGQVALLPREAATAVADGMTRAGQTVAQSLVSFPIPGPQEAVSASEDRHTAPTTQTGHSTTVATDPPVWYGPRGVGRHHSPVRGKVAIKLAEPRGSSPHRFLFLFLCVCLLGLGVLFFSQAVADGVTHMGRAAARKQAE